MTVKNEESNTFLVHRSCHGLPDMKFVMSECGLHLCVGPIKGNMFVQTVEENKKPYIKAQVARATEARKYYDALLCPNSTDFSNILNLGGIRGCNLTKEDADISFKIFGPSFTKGKGNTTRQATKLSPSSIVSIPKEVIRAQQGVVLCIDFFYINQKHIFLTTYSENICFTTNSHVVNRKVKSYWPLLKAVCLMYLAGNVADMSPTCRPDTVMSANFSRKGMSQRHKTCKKRPRHTQFISITANKFKSAQTYRYISHNTFFVFELKKQSHYCRHLKTSRHLKRCHDMSSNVVSFQPPGRHNIFLCRQHDQRHAADTTHHVCK